jgi:hypothetical protein
LFTLFCCFVDNFVGINEKISAPAGMQKTTC